jgi:Tfp pilus assembly protein PilF
VAWCVLGDGALARAAVERALALEPDYRLAQLVAAMVNVAFRPPVTA